MTERMGNELSWDEHAGFLRRLGRSLLRAESRQDLDGEDLAQDAWIVAREHPPRGSSNPRGWLSGVVRNLARERNRSSRSRAHREQSLAREESVADTHQVAERVELVQRVSAAVLALQEPLRTAIHLRYYEGHTPTQIADELGVKLETVRTRLRRGRDHLRARLDEEYGSQHAWAPLLTVLVNVSPTGAPLRGPSETGGTTEIASVAKAATLTGALGIMNVKLAVIVGVAIVGAGAFFWPRETLETQAGAGEPVTENTSTELTPPIAGSPDEAAPVTALERRTVPVKPAATPSAEPEGEPEGGRVEVSGTLAIFTEGLLDQARPTGSVRLLELSPEGQGWITIEVTDGEWSALLYPGSELKRPKITVTGDSRMAILTDKTVIVPEDDRPLSLEARWIPESVLRVVDAETGQDLAGVEVRVRLNWRAIGRDEIPGDDKNVKLVLEGATSPIRLPPLRTLHRTYWVRAAGYAWGRVFYDNETGGERRVELVPASALRVQTIGDVPDGARLRLRRLHNPPFHDGEVLPDPTGETRIEGLRPGTYRIALELGSFQSTTPVGAAEVEVLPGQEALVELRVDWSVMDLPLAPLAGTVRIPTGHEFGDYALHFQFVSSDTERSQGTVHMKQWERDSNDPTLVHWRTADVVPGTYDVYVQPVFHRAALVVPPTGIEDFHVELPQAASARISFVDRQTRAVIRPERANWMDGAIPGMPRNMSLDLIWNSEFGSYVIETVAGEIWIDLSDSNYGTASHSLDLAPGVSEHEFELDRAQSITISFFEGDAQLTGTPGDLMSAFWGITLSGPDPLPDGTFTNGSRVFYVSEPGAYEITIGEVPGYERVPPRRVDVGLGESVEVRVDLERREK